MSANKKDYKSSAGSALKQTSTNAPFLIKW